MTTKTVVLIGGGSGISSILKGIKHFQEFEIYSISTPTDDGGSTGKILKIYEDVIPLGDIRNCIASLAEDPILEELLQYRFDRAELNKHALGNLILLALYKLSQNDINQFTEKIYKLFKIRGKALLSCQKRGILVAKMQTGQIIRGQTLINNFIDQNNSEIEEVFLEEIQNKDVNPLALDAIKKADIIIIGPGSIYSSIIPNFLVQQILIEYKKSKALKIYISNIVNQPNECQKYLLSDYIKILKKYGIETDYILFNNKKADPSIFLKYLEKDPRYKLIENDIQQENIIEENLLDEKSNLIRHDGIKVTKTILKLINSLEKTHQQKS
ncbi:MAG: uridine diphosphate-N-acetylglucosamine-binding protein YvcK [Candidatus Calescibacterium sp.]|nr:uridine diphosphate-N-acetylglucosamine-binding protein YvcK [Candidatus Calescibacterium sp.]MCX7972686.1 uridine diphosphate-N-acetylglucosamine-binding protein YvcK [bacterium]MDW8194717.1 uridine diphosphate-N-acetylglucosamine-binding protein YvcK [Candidatus Calescibacterium sp.]